MKNALQMISCQHFLSGIGQYSFHLSDHLIKAGHEVNLLKPYKPNYPDNHYDRLQWISPARYRSVGPMHPYLLPLFLARKLAKSPQQRIFHAHWFLSGLAASYLKKQFVVTMHDVSLLHISEKSSRYTQYYRWALNRFKKLEVPIITVSETARKDAIEFGGFSEEKVFAIHNGIDFSRFFPKENKETTTGFTIGYVGGLGPRKNIALLLKAFQKVEKRYPEAQLQLAGAFPERTLWPQMAKEIGLRNVKFTGFIADDQLADFYRSTDLFVYPSEYEGFGFAPLEAMACGIPVLSAKGGSLEEVSGGGATCFNYDANELAEKICFLMDHPTELNKLALKGIRWVRQYNWQKTARQTQEVYKLIQP